MNDSQQTPKMTPEKAVAATIGSLVCWFVFAFLGLTPTLEELVSENLSELIAALAALAAMALVPGASGSSS